MKIAETREAQTRFESFRAAPEVRFVLLAAAETREGDDNEERPKPTTVDEVAKVAAIFPAKLLITCSEMKLGGGIGVTELVLRLRLLTNGREIFVADRLLGWAVVQ